MARFWWHFPGLLERPDRLIDVAVAETARDACLAFGVPFPNGCVHQLHSPDLIEMCEGLIVGDVVKLKVQQLPSFYDQYKDWRGYDWARMKLDGIDVS